MDGLLIIDKPAGITSHDVVARVRRTLKTKRVGHTGTLDPFATGVIVVLVGKATRLAQFLDKDKKEYLATVRLGFETETGDRTGSPRAATERSEPVTTAEIKAVLSEFLGETDQTPPMYSAKKVEGRKLYELARKGIEIERKPVRITIHDLELVDIAEPAVFTIRVACSAGAYIRTLAEDIGRRLGTGAHLTELRRTAAGKFGLNDAITLDDLEKRGDATEALRPVREAIARLPVFELTDDRVEKTRNGMSSRDPSNRFADGDALQMVDANGRLIAVGYFSASEKAVLPRVVLV